MPAPERVCAAGAFGIEPLILAFSAAGVYGQMVCVQCAHYLSGNCGPDFFLRDLRGDLGQGVCVGGKGDNARGRPLSSSQGT